MTTDVFEAEFISKVATTARRKVGLEVAEPARKRGYSTREMVTEPAVIVGFLAYMGLFGGLLVLHSAARIWLDFTHDWAWFIVIGLPWALSCTVSYRRYVKQLKAWNELQWRYETLEVEPGQELPERELQIEQTAPGHHVVLQANWIGNWKRELANRVHNNRGEWIGGDSLVRDRHLKEPTLIVHDANNQFKEGGKIRVDLVRLGWITEDLRWTDKGREELRARVFRTSPPQGAGT